jgi:hypothetical protein
MKKIIVSIFILFAVTAVNAQTKDEKAVAAAVERLCAAMIDGNRAELEALSAEKLSYGHSSGHIDDKKDFVEKIVSGKSDFVSIELSEQSLSISGKAAIVRHF